MFQINLNQKQRNLFYFYLFASPALLGFLLFTVGPMLATLLYSFTEYQITGPMRFIGLDNYRTMLLGDPLVLHALRVTAYYVLLGVPLRMMAQVLIALALNRSLKGTNIFRTVLYLPSILSGVALALVWMWLLNPEFGLLNYLLWTFFHIEGPAWLYSSRWVVPGLIIMSFWQIGPGIIINLAGLQGIPQELYEAAEIDGAGSWHRFLRITIPLMTPVIFFNLIIGIISNFQVFTQAYVMTNGGPSNASLFYVLYLYRHAFQYFNMGYASALAWLLFFIILGLTVIIFRSSSLWVFYEARR